ncbi:hypothetical protein Fmac_032373 [Flemingia macrophylla]|uniref:Glutamine amidotransferase type-2 domain-containing protein n=1 Tax=Flemingia macrophylla TaxID=520843 RepID=A0ABD1L4Q9_9FABA
MGSHIDCQQMGKVGTYSIVFLTEDKLVVVHDPFGFRPLVMGRRSNGVVVFASETCALDLIEATYEREVFPGEFIVVDKNGLQSLCLMTYPQPKQCIFEHIYFALPNSFVFCRSVYDSRCQEPRRLQCCHRRSRLRRRHCPRLRRQGRGPFPVGPHQVHYVGRTFNEPTQKIPDFGVKLKLSPVQT